MSVLKSNTDHIENNDFFLNDFSFLLVKTSKSYETCIHSFLLALILNYSKARNS